MKKVQSKDFRIGNYAYDFLGVLIKLSARDIFRFDEGLMNTEQYKPIRFDDYIGQIYLKRLGFEKTGVDGKSRLKKGWHWIEIDNCSLYINGKQIVLIDYIHEIQNLFFLLTKEELHFQE